MNVRAHQMINAKGKKEKQSSDRQICVQFLVVNLSRILDNWNVY